MEQLNVDAVKTVVIGDKEASQTKEEMLERISLLSDEIDANEEENRLMQWEIDGLYKKIDAL